MVKNIKCLESSEGNVWKYIFDFGDAIAEAVLYRYGTFEERTVICCSVQSGCPVGCLFCGTGKHFVRNLTVEEIVGQIEYILKDKNIESIDKTCEKFQIMFMSMGEPMLNWYNVKYSILQMYHGLRWENAQYLISTIGVEDDEVFKGLIELSEAVPNVGLQFSIHHGYETMRNILIPFKNKMSLRKLRDAGIVWSESTGRKVFLNYCVTDENYSLDELGRLKDLFSPYRFNFTFSTVCTADETMKQVGIRDLSKIERVAESFSIDGYNTRVFNPAGQDDIGGGCGQLWYVQEWLSKYENK